MKNKKINLNLTIEEINKILTALGNLPYSQVFLLIQKIQKQTEEQITEIEEVMTN